MGLPKNIQYITEETGEKKTVVLPVEDYEELLEDIQDLVTVAERKNEKSLSLGSVLIWASTQCIISRSGKPTENYQRNLFTL